jgi:hypothetical protein
MFSLILVIISLGLISALAIATLDAGNHAQQSQSLRQQRLQQQQVGQAQQQAEHAHVVFREEKSAEQRANQVLDQAQQLLGAASLYAGRHGGALPTEMAQLKQGYYLSQDVTPPDGVSPGGYSLESDKDGFRVSLMVTDVSTCQHIQDSARESKTGAPYRCIANGDGYTFTFKG